MADTADTAMTSKRSWAEAFRAYASPRVLVMLVLGFSSGLPFLLIFSTLSAWLTEAGVSLKDIGLASYVGLAFTIKFLWAPLVDRLPLPLLGRWLGRRRAWMLLAQVAVAAGIFLMSTIDPGTNLIGMVGAAVFVAFASATQDIAIDAWRIEAAENKDAQATMAAATQLGYRLALIAAGAGALYIADGASWSVSYATMATLMGIGMIGTFFAFRPPEQAAAASPAADFAPRQGFLRWLYDAAVAPFVDFFARNRWTALLILAAIGFYRLPDFVMGVMANPFYLDLGFTKSEIASVSKLFGIWMTIVGAMLGGLVAPKLGIMRMLLIGAFLVSITNLAYAWLATVGPDVGALTVTISLENLAGGFGGTALIAYMSSLTSTAFTATQYALFSSFFALPGKIVGGMSGYMVEGLGGFYWFFILTAVMGLPAVFFVWMLIRAQARAALAKPGPA